MSKLLENLNKEQKETVTHSAGPLLIVAGAGTGKTTVITRRIAYLIEQGLAKPDEILSLTFTEKAASEMADRVNLLLPLGYYDMWISTFHSFCERILKYHALDIGISNDFKLLNDVDQWILVYKNFDKFKLNYYKPLGSPNRFVDALLSHFSRCKDETVTPEEYLAYAESLRLSTGSVVKAKKSKKADKPGRRADVATAEVEKESTDETEIARLEEVAGAYHTYQKLLLDNNCLDFADLINYAILLFRSRPKILNYYQKKFKYILVDEFQDTNFAQYQLVKLLAAGHKNLVVVGDDDQSIYKFRGASVSNILKFKEDYPDIKQITLVENYRSSQNILDLAYNFIQANNPDRLEVKLKIDKALKANTEEKGMVAVLEADHLSGEMNAVAKKICELKNGPGNTWNDFAILMRANSSANELLPVLASYGIPYTYVANRGLYKKPIINDLISYLKVLEDCHDSASLYHVFTLPKFHISHHDLSTLLHESHKKTLSLYEMMEKADTLANLAADSKQKVSQLVSALRHHTARMKSKSAAELAVDVIRDLGIDKKVTEDTLENAQNRELLEQFYQKIENFERDNADRSLHHFLYVLELEMQAGSDGNIDFDMNAGPESVKVLTVHSAKGLEFKHVFVIGMVDQRFPTREKRDAIEMPLPLIKDILPQGDFHLQEERRLFYVAITRAKLHLYLTWARDYGGSRTKKPSLFLQETKLVPSDIVSRATGKVVFTKPASGSIVYSQLPERFSYSQLNDFETCPLKYKYQHYLKLPVPGNCHLSFGQTIHKVFEEYLSSYKNSLELNQLDLFGNAGQAALPDFKLLEQSYEKNWVDDWYKNKGEKEEYRLLGKKMLKTFYDETVLHAPKPKYIEKFFNLPLGNYQFVGKIDRADQSEGGITIIDYKTGKTPNEKAKKKNLDQLYIYQWAAEEYLKETVVGLNYWFLQDNQRVVEAIADKEQIGELKGRLLEIVERIVEVTKYDLFKQEHDKAKDHRCEFEDLE